MHSHIELVVPHGHKNDDLNVGNEKNHGGEVTCVDKGGRQAGLMEDVVCDQIQ